MYTFCSGFGVEDTWFRALELILHVGSSAAFWAVIPGDRVSKASSNLRGQVTMTKAEQTSMYSLNSASKMSAPVVAPGGNETVGHNHSMRRAASHQKGSSVQYCSYYRLCSCYYSG